MAASGCVTHMGLTTEIDKVVSLGVQHQFFAHILEQPSTDRKIDLIYSRMDDLLLIQDVAEIRLILRDMPAALADEPLSVFLSALTVTLPWRETLGEERKAIAAYVRGRDPARADALLRGLEG